MSQSEISLDGLFLKCVLDGQNNINKLIAMQEQQMFYINIILNEIRNKNVVSTATTGTTGNTEQQGESKVTNPQPVTKKN